MKVLTNKILWQKKTLPLLLIFCAFYFHPPLNLIRPHFPPLDLFFPHPHASGANGISPGSLFFLLLETLLVILFFAFTFALGRTWEHLFGSDDHHQPFRVHLSLISGIFVSTLISLFAILILPVPKPWFWLVTLGIFMAILPDWKQTGLDFFKLLKLGFFKKLPFPGILFLTVVVLSFVQSLLKDNYLIERFFFEPTLFQETGSLLDGLPRGLELFLLPLGYFRSFFPHIPLLFSFFFLWLSLGIIEEFFNSHPMKVTLGEMVFSQRISGFWGGILTLFLFPPTLQIFYSGSLNLPVLYFSILTPLYFLNSAPLGSSKIEGYVVLAVVTFLFCPLLGLIPPLFFLLEIPTLGVLLYYFWKVVFSLSVFFAWIYWRTGNDLFSLFSIPPGHFFGHLTDPNQSLFLVNFLIFLPGITLLFQSKDLRNFLKPPLIFSLFALFYFWITVPVVLLALLVLTILLLSLEKTIPPLPPIAFPLLTVLFFIQFRGVTRQYFQIFDHQKKVFDKCFSHPPPGEPEFRILYFGEILAFKNSRKLIHYSFFSHLFKNQKDFATSLGEIKKLGFNLVVLDKNFNREPWKSSLTAKNRMRIEGDFSEEFWVGKL